MLNNYPSVLKKKILAEFAACIGSIVFFVVVTVVFKNYLLSLPILAVALFFGFIGGQTVYLYEKNKIISIEGNCLEVLKSFSKTKTSTIFIQAEDKRVQIRPKERYRQYRQGDYIVVYIKTDMDVYKEGNTYVLNDYVAMQITSVENEPQNEPQKASSVIKNILSRKN